MATTVLAFTVLEGGWPVGWTEQPLGGPLVVSSGCATAALRPPHEVRSVPLSAAGKLSLRPPPETPVPTVHASLVQRCFCVFHLPQSTLDRCPLCPWPLSTPQPCPCPTSSPPAKDVEEVGHAGCPIRLERTTLACPSGRSVFLAPRGLFVSNRLESGLTNRPPVPKPGSTNRPPSLREGAFRSIAATFR